MKKICSLVPRPLVQLGQEHYHLFTAATLPKEQPTIIIGDIIANIRKCRCACALSDFKKCTLALEHCTCQLSTAVNFSSLLFLFVYFVVLPFHHLILESMKCRPCV